MSKKSRTGLTLKGWIKMLCFGELLIKRDSLEWHRSIMQPKHKIYFDNHILAVDLRISRISI
jgi:hypothetical protein